MIDDKRALLDLRRSEVRTKFYNWCLSEIENEVESCYVNVKAISDDWFTLSLSILEEYSKTAQLQILIGRLKLMLINTMPSPDRHPTDEEKAIHSEYNEKILHEIQYNYGRIIGSYANRHVQSSDKYNVKKCFESHGVPVNKSMNSGSISWMESVDDFRMESTFDFKWKGIYEVQFGVSLIGPDHVALCRPISIYLALGLHPLTGRMCCNIEEVASTTDVYLSWLVRFKQAMFQ